MAMPTKVNLKIALILFHHNILSVCTDKTKSLPLMQT